MSVDDVLWAVEEKKERAELYKSFNDYYEGDHPLLFATEKFRNTFGTLFQAFADNLCPAVVDCKADRLSIEAWDGDLGDKANKLYTDRHVRRSLAQVFSQAARTGDAYMLVWPNEDNNVQFWPHDADLCCVEYDDEDDPWRVIKGAKVWMADDDRCRLNLYYDDHIEKWVTRGKCNNGVPTKKQQWEAFAADVDNPYGVVPLFHFGNNANVGEYGVSELINAIPIQNALNKSICDMLVAGEFVAYPQRWATGLQVEVDEDTGKPKNPPFTPGVDRVWTAAGEVKFGEFSMADLKGFIDEQDSFRLEMGRVSVTPAHLLGLQEKWPTGEALKVAEGRLIKHVQKLQTNYSDVAVRMELCGLVMNGDIGSVDNQDGKLIPIWTNAAPHNPLLDAETQLVLQQVGVSKKQSLRELGYDDTKIDEMMKENEEAAQKQADLAMQSVAPAGGPNAFNRNGGPGKASKPAPQQQQKVPVPMPRAGRGETSD